jgi:hypothetical protein
LTGQELAAAIRTTWAVDDPIACVHLKVIAVATDRRRVLDAALDGPDGLLAQLALGKVAASAVNVILKAHQRASEQFAAAVTALDLEPAAMTRTSQRHQEAS